MPKLSFPAHLALFCAKESACLSLLEPLCLSLGKVDVVLVVERQDWGTINFHKQIRLLAQPEIAGHQSWPEHSFKLVGFKPVESCFRLSDFVIDLFLYS